MANRQRSCIVLALPDCRVVAGEVPRFSCPQVCAATGEIPCSLCDAARSLLLASLVRLALKSDPQEMAFLLPRNRRSSADDAYASPIGRRRHG